VTGSGNVLDDCFTGFRFSALRLEVLPAYNEREEAASLAAWRARRPRPERSLRNDGYLREVAEDVLAGRQRQRVRVVDEPLSDYVRWELEAYAENQATGEEIRVAVRKGGSDRAQRDLAQAIDVWLFDIGEEDERAVLMYYESDGTFASAHLATAADHAWARKLAARAWQHSVPLNEYVARRRKAAAA
jgi:hypothetical protein